MIACVLRPAEAGHYNSCCCSVRPQADQLSSMTAPSPGEILLSSEQIQQPVAELAVEIRRDAPDNLHLVAVLKGAFVFVADLVRCLSGPVSLDFMSVSSYE